MHTKLSTVTKYIPSEGHHDIQYMVPFLVIFFFYFLRKSLKLISVVRFHGHYMGGH